jgi:hypothetical protein
LGDFPPSNDWKSDLSGRASGYDYARAPGFKTDSAPFLGVAPLLYPYATIGRPKLATAIAKAAATRLNEIASRIRVIIIFLSPINRH